MKCLVTGGVGFIGSHICNRLVSLGHEVIAYDNMIAGLNSPNCKLIKDDVLHIFDWEDELKDVDVIFNQMASKKNICLRNPARDLDVNGKGTLMIMLFAQKHGIRVIHASTGSVYGEVDSFPITEETPLNPVSYYGVSKLAGDRYVSMFTDVDSVILRYFHVYGANQDYGEFGGVVSIFAERIVNGIPIVIHGDGEQLRSFTYVDDVVNANIAAMTKGTGQVYNCASGIKVTINQLVDAIERQTGLQAIRTYGSELPGDIRYFEVDNTKIKKELGVSFRDLTLDWI